MKEFIFETPEARLNIAEGPANGPLLVLFHGFTNRWQEFSALLPELTKDWHVLSFDHRGHGKSGRVPSYNALGFYRDIQAFSAEYIQEPAVIIGHSMGGMMALYQAVERPEVVKAVVAGDTSLELPVHHGIMNGRRNVKLFGLRRRLAGHPVEELVRRGIPQETAEELSGLDPDTMIYHSEGRVQDFFEEVQPVDLARIHCPTMIVQANPEKGGLLTDGEVARAKSLRPDFTYLRIDAGHDLDIAKGPDAPFFKSAMEFLHRQTR